MPDPASEFRHAVAASLDGAADAVTAWRSLGRCGVLGQVTAGLCEGAAVDVSRLDDFLAELDARFPPGVTLSMCVQVATVIPLLRLAGGSGGGIADQVLKRMIGGESLVALAATDADTSGSDLLDIRTAVSQDGDRPILNGGKAWITNAGQCDYILTLARRRTARHFTSLGWVLVPAGHPGISFKPATSELFYGAAVGHLSFTDVQLEPGWLIGRPGRALADFALTIAVERLAGALWARALCRRVLADTHRFLRHRQAGEGCLWDNAAIRETFARCVVEWHRLDAMCARYGDNVPRPGPAMVLKAACSQSVERILSACVQLRGAEAFRDGGLSSLREQAMMFGIAGGATGAMLAGVAERVAELLGVPG